MYTKQIKQSITPDMAQPTNTTASQQNKAFDRKVTTEKSLKPQMTEGLPKVSDRSKELKDFLPTGNARFDMVKPKLVLTDWVEGIVRKIKILEECNLFKEDTGCLTIPKEQANQHPITYDTGYLYVSYIDETDNRVADRSHLVLLDNLLVK